MPRGGKRIGSGAKPGVSTKKTRAIADQAAKHGITPLEVMLDNMRYLHKQAQDAEAMLALMRPEQVAELDPEKQFDFMLAEVKKAAGLRLLSQSAASDAARFCHPPLSPVDSQKRDSDHVPLAERLKAYAREDAITKSEGKVVELQQRK